MREHKLVVLGSGGVGKSAITIQFVQSVFVEKYDPTIEDSYRKHLSVDGRASLLEVLDTAGTEQFTAMRDLYLKNGSGFILMYAITSLPSFEELFELYDQVIRVKGTNKVPLVLVGNKSDLESERVILYEQGQSLANGWGKVKFLETSARLRSNVDEVFVELVRSIQRQSPDPVLGRRKLRRCTLI